MDERVEFILDENGLITDIVFPELESEEGIEGEGD